MWQCAEPGLTLSLRARARLLQSNLPWGIMSTHPVSTSISPKLVDRLAKICGLLGSDSDGERASAAFQATKLLQGAGITWRELVEAAAGKTWPHEHVRTKPVKRPPKRNPPPPKPSKPDWSSMMTACILLSYRLEQWERSYISHLKARGMRPSEKDLRVLEDIYNHAMASHS